MFNNIEEKLRKTGIKIIGDVPWGTHFCQFYQNKEDLIDILVPYFRVGLEKNEFCMWVTSEPLNEEEIKEAMEKAVPDFDKNLKRGQIEIVQHTEWYFKDGVFNSQSVLNGWIDKLNQAIARGYDGMRITGNATWLGKRDWRDFANYEEKVNSAIKKYKMIAVCTYPLNECGAYEVIDVVRNHQFAFIKQEGEWGLIENLERKRADEVLRESENRYRSIADNIQDGLTITGNGKVTYVNDRACEIIGYPRDELVKLTGIDMAAPEERERLQRISEEVVQKGHNLKDQEFWIIRKDGSRRCIHNRYSFIHNGGVISRLVVTTDITERKKAEKQLKMINECFLNLCPDFDKNINQFTALCGEILGATCALYNRLKSGMLYSLGQWHTPPDYNPKDRPEGHICYDVIQQGGSDVFIVRHLPDTVYAKTDPNVTRYNLRTYIGKAIKYGNEYVGSLCVVFQSDIEPTENEKQILGIIASAISVEEERKKATDKITEYTSKLKEQKLALEQKNLALKEMIEHIERAKNKIKEDIAINVNETVLPILEKLKIKGASSKYIDLLHRHLEELVSSYGRKLTQKSTKLTYREIEICNMIKSGVTTKEVSDLLNVSPQTIERHRKNIRKKLAISNKKVNLTSYLQSL